MIVTFNDKGALINISEGKTVIREHLDLCNNLHMVPVDDTNKITVRSETPTITRNIVKISQRKASIVYAIKGIPKLIKYLHATANFPVKKYG